LIFTTNLFFNFIQNIKQMKKGFILTSLEESSIFKTDVNMHSLVKSITDKFETIFFLSPKS